jgi:hypothetical protein
MALLMADARLVSTTPVRQLAWVQQEIPLSRLATELRSEDRIADGTSSCSRQSASVVEQPDSVEDHRHPVLIAGGDYISVSQ